MGRAALIVAAGVALSRLLGLVRDMVFAATLGANTFTDEYQVAFLIPDFLNYLLAGGYMAITFIPILSRHLAEDDEEAGWRSFGSIAVPVGAAMAVLVAIAMVAARPVIDAVVPGFDTDQVERAARLTRIVLPAQFFFIVGSLFMAVQYAREQFVVPTLAPIIYNIGIIAGGLLLTFDGERSPEGFTWGVLAGSIVGNFALQAYGAWQVGWRPRWAGRFADPALREYLGLAIPLMVGQSLVVLDELLGRTFGSLAEADGSISWLQYGRRTMLVPVAIVAQAAGVAAYPYLARLAAEGRIRELVANLGVALRYVVTLSVGAAAGLVALAIPVVRLLYERGDWTATDTVATAGTLVFFALGIPLWGAQQLYARAFYARRRMWTPVLVGTGATIVAVPIYWGLLGAMDIDGLALASTIALALYTAVLAFLWHRDTGWEELTRLRTTAARAVPLAAAGGLVAWLVGELVTRSVTGGAGAVAAIMVAVVGFFGTVFLGVAAVERIGRWGAPQRPPPG